jgi:archaellum component FlaC
MSEDDINRTVEELESNINKLKFRLKRTIKNIRYCREACKNTAQIIGEVTHGTSQEHK